ncbi:adenylyl-sulfate kinase [Paenibacillus bovis]|uniref:Adenylyl-sulfate kinase n=1 Tax=Paenibacillus bovis TaxID=1616788 RepID=A0A172ZEZ4_9BACL|nr:adenylyl-sulfate kinase [Paenibacillus bovis]ANF95857.1 adenylyl-sulfate kinase [Paenibacillus bovis]
MTESQQSAAGSPYITRNDRERILRQKGRVLWLTGLSGSGKSTLAFALEHELFLRGQSCYVLDGDRVRQGLNSDLGFAPEDRRENLRRIGEVARILLDSGQIVIAALISPHAPDRQMVREMFQPEDFCEIYVNCSLATCEQRDPKGLYIRARSGAIPQFTGISAPYDIPEQPELVINTEFLSVEESVMLIMETLELSAVPSMDLSR